MKYTDLCARLEAPAVLDSFIDPQSARAAMLEAAAAIRELEAEGDKNWSKYLSERDARMASNMREATWQARAEAAEARAAELTRDAGEAERSVYDRTRLPPVTVHQACTWPTCLCTAKGQFCQGAVRVTLQPAPDAVEALVKAAAQDAREVFEDCGSKAREAIDYMEQVALATIRKGATP